MDELLAQATVERDLEKRKRLYAEFQQIVVADAPVAFTHVWPQGFAGRFDWVSALIALGAAVALLRFKLNVIHVIAGCAIVGYLVKSWA